MRASALLTFIFIAAQHTITGMDGIQCGHPESKEYMKKPKFYTDSFRMECIDGYKRQAGTSNLFVCEHDSKTNFYNWTNYPPLKCIPDPSKPIAAPSTAVTAAGTVKPTSVSLANTQAPTPVPTLTHSTSSTTATTYCSTTGKTQSTSTTSGQTALTTATPHTTTGHHRTTTTTTKEKTTSNRITLSSPATLTVTENITTLAPQSTRSAISSTTEVSGTNADATSMKKEIAVGTVLALIVVAASAAGVLFWCRRSRHRDISRTQVEMNVQLPSPEEPLLPCSYPSDPAKTPNSHIPLAVQDA